jgi:CxxC motif-containing protein
MEKTFTCINCPIGCQLTADIEGDQVTKVQGAGCNRGIAYAQQEALHPTRMVTAVVNVPACELPLSVKTASPIPKEKIFDCMKAIEAAQVNTPVHIGDVVCRNVCGTGVDVVSTRELP